ncbi:MAG: hypothetical protein AB7E79_16495 [Rhodospirillaceae bacterium]
MSPPLIEEAAAPSDDTRAGRARHYREQAAACRRHAGDALSDSARADYQRMAEEWDKLADEVTVWSVRMAGLRE